MYRLSWEMVDLSMLRYYSDADPAYHKGTTQTVPNSQIPDEHWYPISTQDEDPWDQYRQLQAWAADDTNFVRNVTLERMVTEPVWEPVEDPHVAEIVHRGIRDSSLLAHKEDDHAAE